MPTELLAQVVEELSISNAGMHYAKPRKVDRPQYIQGKSPDPYRSAMNRLLASAPARPPRQGGGS